MRKELSIAACLLAVGHVISYVPSYAALLAGGQALRGHIALALLVAFVLVVLLLVLGVTSVSAVKRRMGLRLWKRLQRLAYPFIACMYIHVLLMLVPSALHGGSAALGDVLAYSAVFFVYAIARMRRAVLDSKGSA